VKRAAACTLLTLALAGACIDFSKLTQDYGKDGGLAGDAGSDSGSSPDAGGSDGGCPSSGFFCEDFEADNLNAWRRDANPSGFMSLDIESAVAHSGTHALRAVSLPPDGGVGPGGGDTITHFFPAVAQGRLALRAWLMTPTQSGDYASWLWLSVDAGTSSLLGYIAATGANAAPAEGWIVSRQPLVTGSDHPSQVLQKTGVWQCVELVIDMPDGGAPGHVELFIDGGSVVSFDDATLDASLTSYGALTIGMVRSNDDRPEARYIDDVVLAAHRIGCN
jgi:hypothetical protein